MDTKKLVVLVNQLVAKQVKKELIEILSSKKLDAIIKERVEKQTKIILSKNLKAVIKEQVNNSLASISVQIDNAGNINLVNKIGTVGAINENAQQNNFKQTAFNKYGVNLDSNIVDDTRYQIQQKPITFAKNPELNRILNEVAMSERPPEYNTTKPMYVNNSNEPGAITFTSNMAQGYNRGMTTGNPNVSGESILAGIANETNGMLLSHDNRPIHVQNINPGVIKALTRNYRDVVAKSEELTNKRKSGKIKTMPTNVELGTEWNAGV